MNRPSPSTLIPAVIVLAALLPLPSLAGDFMDTRVSFIISDQNFFAKPGETQVNNPGLGIGGGKTNTLFFDNYDTKYTGFETLSQLVLYKKMPSFFENLTTEATLAVRVMITGEQAVALSDAGSFIQLTYDFSGGTAKDENLQLVLFPISGDRFRLGYSYRISWGGSDIFPLNYGLVPAAKLQLNLPWGYAFLGLKTTQINEYLKGVSQTEMVTNYGVLGGLGIDISGFRAEANGGYFTRGVFPQLGVRGEAIYGGGVSYQIGYHQGMPIGTSIDFALYRNDPDIDVKFFKPETYGEGLSFMIKHEGTFLFQTLIDPDRESTTVNQLPYAFDLNFSMKVDFWRIHADAMIRTLSYLLYNVPSFTPYYDFPKEAQTQPEYFASAGFDYFFSSLHLTPGLVFGVQHPASYTINNLQIGQALFTGKRTVVVWDISTRSVLPINQDATLIWSIKATLRWDISEILAVVAELYFTYDDNRTRYVSDINGMNIVTQWDNPSILGLNLVAQARF